MNINPHSLSFPAKAGLSSDRSFSTENQEKEDPTSVVFNNADRISLSVAGLDASEKSKSEESEKEQQNTPADPDSKKKKLSNEEKRKLEELQARDKEVKQHEKAHLQAAGHYATSGPSYHWQKGPDGEQYAIGGEVGIDTSEIAGNPEETIKKMEQVKRAAMAPAGPSSQDYRVAAKAESKINRARAELSEQKNSPAMQAMPHQPNKRIRLYGQFDNIPAAMSSSLQISA